MPQPTRCPPQSPLCAGRDAAGPRWQTASPHRRQRALKPQERARRHDHRFRRVPFAQTLHPNKQAARGVQPVHADRASNRPCSAAWLAPSQVHHIHARPGAVCRLRAALSVRARSRRPMHSWDLPNLGSTCCDGCAIVPHNSSVLAMPVRGLIRQAPYAAHATHALHARPCRWQPVGGAGRERQRGVLQHCDGCARAFVQACKRARWRCTPGVTGLRRGQCAEGLAPASAFVPRCVWANAGQQRAVCCDWCQLAASLPQVSRAEPAVLASRTPSAHDARGGVRRVVPRCVAHPAPHALCRGGAAAGGAACAAPHRLHIWRPAAGATVCDHAGGDGCAPLRGM